MEFYKEGKVITLSANQTLDLSSPVYNHKAVYLIAKSAASNTAGSVLNIKFYTKGAKSSTLQTTGVPCVVGGTASTATFTNCLIPVRLAEIASTGALDPDIFIVLLN
jgi:hypothetical protein